MVTYTVLKFRYLSKEKIGEIPRVPGVYSFKGARGILYIGKAANLRVRVKNHFSQPTYRDNMFVGQTTRVGYIELASEIEALILESQLIKKYQPRYNVLLKDDKQYFYVCFTNEALPRIVVTHQPKGLKIENLKLKIPPRGVAGPFTDGKSLKTVLRYLRRPFPYYTQKHRKLPCSYCHIGLCPGPSPNIREYKKNISKIKAILTGKKPRVITSLRKEMANFAKNLEFEKAVKARNQIAALENIFSHKTDFLFPATISSRSLKIKNWKLKISSLEAYDISNIQGREPVASMVRFDNGKPNKSMYRKFKIRLPEKPNDVAMIKEVIRRRLAHPEWPYPDVFLIDGGRGQLNAALSQLSVVSGQWSVVSCQLSVVALAKRLNELYIPGRKSPILLSKLPAEAKNLMMHARDEAHRFAISYHRKLHRQRFR